MTGITKEMTIGEILRTNPDVAPVFTGGRNALSWMSFRTGRISGRGSNGSRH